MIHQRLVTIDAVHPDGMRYPTEGDWQLGPDDVLHIAVTSNMPRREQMLLALHELVEALLCEARGITQAQVDAFDFAFTGEGEPGDCADAPYRREHRFAALIDHLVAHEMGVVPYGRVDWEPPD